jgi:hypothetical protein
VKVKFIRIGYPLYCDAGPHEGDMRIDLTIKLYLSPDEYARYADSESLQITLSENGDRRLPLRSTAEPSGELSAGDVAASDEAALTGVPAGGTTAAGAVRESRAGEPGPSPLPAAAPAHGRTAPPRLEPLPHEGEP